MLLPFSRNGLQSMTNIWLAKTPYLVAEGTLGECIRLFTSKPMSQLHLYEIHTAPQGELIAAVLSAQQIIELAGLWGFL